MNRMNTVFRGLALCMLALAVSACMGQQIRARSSVVDYLYPGRAATVVEPSTPVLKLPVKVGIAFVPEQAPSARGGIFLAQVRGGEALTETRKAELLERVAAHFRKHDFVSDIEVIPSAYLTPGGGFANLDQIRTMYGVDVIALVSYDQVQFTDEGLASIAYWTLVGAYMISGEKNDTSTMLDTVVYDIPSRKMLFRAPGTSKVKGRATPINLSEELRADSERGFELATDRMIANLDRELERFRERVRRNPEAVKIVHRPGFGGGALGWLEIGLLLALLLAPGAWRRGTARR